LQFYPHVRACGVVAKLIIGGKDDTGNGIPEGLPLNCRFSHLIGFEKPRMQLLITSMVNSILRWRTLILVILRVNPCVKDHALSSLG